MTGTEHIDRLPELLTELAAPRRPDYTDAILARTAGQRQRPARTFLERILPMSETTLPSTRALPPPVRTFAIVLLLTALAVALATGAFIASRPSAPLPAPFGPAANGLIPYVSAGDIYVADLVTGDRRLLVGGQAGDALPQFSPDGTRLAFIRDVRSTTGQVSIEIYVTRVDGSNFQRITPEPIADWRWIAWTPDGRRLAVIHAVDGVNQLDFYDAAGSGTAERITSAAGIDSMAFRPPHGDEILFRALKDGAYGLYVMNADGSGQRNLVRSEFDQGMDLDLGGAVYSADGSRVFYQRAGTAPNPDDGCCRLWVMNADGTDAHEFVSPTGRAWDGQPAVSPDGSRIAFWRAADATNAISVVRADGTGPVIETGPELTGTARFIWAPDSSRILMYPADGSSSSAYLLDPEGGPWTTVPWSSDPDLDWQRIAPAP